MDIDLIYPVITSGCILAGYSIFNLAQYYIKKIHFCHEYRYGDISKESVRSHEDDSLFKKVMFAGSNMADKNFKDGKFDYDFDSYLF